MFITGQWHQVLVMVWLGFHLSLYKILNVIYFVIKFLGAFQWRQSPVICPIIVVFIAFLADRTVSVLCSVIGLIQYSKCYTFGCKILLNLFASKINNVFIHWCALTIKNTCFSFTCGLCVSVLLSCSTDQVLEKAMHKCVLKPLKSVIEVALHDFQVRD